MEKILPLSELPTGQWGRVISLNARGMIRYRLLDLGLVPDTTVQAVRRGPLGDPIVYRIRGALIALRREEAGQVLVTPL
ncbi:MULTISPECIES: FeoA family protein [Desulfofundulus]|uniref:Ferrous iron transport protein A n=1 Tax=Desulfofundulus australicus DSM 11792 TaxID=1121425 RepID=A0A1M5CNM6_9FIRM|nr:MULTISPECIES: FeoA family protein [Desulfofundulus]MBE3585034.1 ferrous iron transport protein A [Thermoanaerobacter sp.]MCS5694557.1 ferrous iron transport protein A [Desulfofundulus thermocisternus]SHF56318.1 ferrous iron transport protein A [Desulfofundulus australicus DSM 11792]